MKTSIKVLIIIGLLLGGILLYSRFVSTKGLKIREYAVVDEKLPDNFNGLKIVHFSDVHYGRTTNIDTLKKVVKKINYLKPDIVIFTGDLFTSGINISEKEQEKIISLFKNIDARIKKIAIKGDNDTKDYNNIMYESAFNVIDEGSDLIYYKGTTPIEITNDYKSVSEFFTILLLHQPDTIDKVDLTNINMVLAGHSLNGQIRIPFYGALIKRTGAKKYTDSFYSKENTLFYISNGLGTEDVSFRLLNTPSINLYRLSNY